MTSAGEGGWLSLMSEILYLPVIALMAVLVLLPMVTLVAFMGFPR